MFRLVKPFVPCMALTWFALIHFGGVSVRANGTVVVDLEDGRFSYETRCAGCHGNEPLNIRRGPSISELQGRSSGELSHGGGQLPYAGVNLTNLAAYFSSADTNRYLLSGVVVDAEGRGVGGVEVTVGSDSIGYAPRAAASAPDGGVRFEGLPAGDHQMACASPVWRFHPQRFETRTIRAGNSSSGLFVAYRPNAVPPTAFPPASIIRVHPQGDDQSNGRAWAAAVRTVSAALLIAPPGSQIWIAGGTYHEVLDVRGQQLFGGFAGGETRLEERDWVRHPSVVDGDPVELSELGMVPNSVVTLSGEPGETARCDGLFVVNGLGDFGGGIRVAPGSAAVIDHCSVLGNQSVYSGGGIFCDQTAALKLAHSVVKGNASGLGGGIHCAFDSVVELTDNLIAANHATTTAGIYADGFVARMVNNTVVQNVNDDGSGTIVEWDGSGTNINNIVAFNSGGIDSLGTPDGWNHNAVFGNTNFDWVNLTPGATDVLGDPHFRDPARGDYRLRPDSPCLDSGNDAQSTLDSTDLAAASRRSRRHIDIGAYELPGPSLSIERRASDIQVRWPADETGFLLETAPEAGSLNWITTGNPARDGDQWLVTLPKSSGTEFYRLHQ